MFNSKLTKLAAAVALTTASSVALAANTLTMTTGTGFDADASAVANIDVSLTAGAKETFAYQLVTNQTFSDSTNLLAYTATNAGIVSGNIIQFDFTNGGVEDASSYVLALVNLADDTDTTVDAAAALPFTVLSSTLTGKTATDGYATQLQFAIGADIGLNDVVLLLKSGSTTPVAGGDIPAILAAKGLADTAKVTASAQALNTSYVTINNTETTAVEVLEADEGLSTATVAATSQSVDFANDSVQFTTAQDGSVFKSESNAFTVAAAGLDNSITIDNGDKVTVTVTGDKCSAVVTDDADAITFAGVNMTYSSGCTWTTEETHDGTDTIWDALEGGTATAVITVNEASATDAVAIDTSSWTVSIVANLNDGAQTNGDDYTAYNNNALANWSGDVQGGKVTIPYVYTSSSDSSQSYITVGNSNASATKVAMNVSYTDRSDDSVTAFNNYYLGEIAAGSQTTWTAKELVARINAADGAADEGFNTTAQTLDVDALAHMTVELVFQNDTGLDDYEVNAFNRANTARYAVGVSYEGANRSKEK